MNYMMITVGLIVAVLLIVQLRNEAESQNSQIRNAFGHLVISVKTKEEAVVYPVVSTSITCGRKIAQRYDQVDLPIATEDESLTGAAAEFTIEPEENRRCIYVRRLEQPTIWVCSADQKNVRCMAAELTQERPEVPEAFYCSEQQVSYLDGKKKLPLHIGDRVLMGNTEFLIDREKEGHR